tara:strand:+ start:2919 stop:3653 length:735 start_codon:yes stop_codon:yes gene_type:complete
MIIKEKIANIFSIFVLTILFLSCTSNIEDNDNTKLENENSGKTENFTDWEYRGFQIKESELNIFLYLIKGEISDIKLLLNDSFHPNQVIAEPNDIYNFKFNNLKDGINSVRISNNKKSLSVAIKNQPFQGKIVESNTIFTIKVNEEVKIKNTGMIVRLISLSRDSRCEDPTDKFDCMHDPRTFLTFQLSAPRYIPESPTILKPQTEIAAGVYHDFPFSIEEIEPPPKKGIVIEQSKYEVKMKVQ